MQNHLTALRKQLRDRCRAIPSIERMMASQQVADHLQTLTWFRGSQHIACYLDDGIELATQASIDLIWQHHKTCYLPIVKDAEPILQFAAYQAHTVLQKNQFNLQQPVLDKSASLLSAEDLDLVLLPLVAFDCQANRLGRGAGYYDKTLAFLRELKTAQRQPKLIGLAYACQEVATLLPASWDVRMDAIITEQGIRMVE